MATTEATTTQQSTTGPWREVVRLSLIIGIVTTIAFAIVATGWTTSSGGDFTYAADYWYTALGLPLASVGFLHALGVYKMQHGRTSHRAKVGVWINSLCCAELFVQVLGSLVTASELRWGPAYPLAALGTVVGLSLLVSGSWRVGLFPRPLLGPWPAIWIAGSFFAQGPTPLLLTAYYVAFWSVLNRSAGKVLPGASAE